MSKKQIPNEQYKSASQKDLQSQEQNKSTIRKKKQRSELKQMKETRRI